MNLKLNHNILKFYKIITLSIVLILLNNIEVFASESSFCGVCGATAWKKGTKFTVVPPPAMGISSCRLDVDFSYRDCPVNKREMRIDNITPNSIILEQNSPNPFSQTTEIRYLVPSSINSDNIAIKITDATGKEIYSFRDITVGVYSTLIINAEFMSSGAYIYSLVVNNQPIISKQFLIHK